LADFQINKKGGFFMAISRTAKVDAEILKVKAKIAEWQTKLKELTHKRTEMENLEIVEIVRGLRIPLDQLAAMLQNIKGGGGSSAGGGRGTSGQVVPKSEPPATTQKETEDENE
jgi:hypothetical protein